MYQPPSDPPRFPVVQTRVHAAKDSEARPYFIWGGIRPRDDTTLIAASCWTRKDAEAEAEIWKTEYEKNGDLDAALDRVTAAREARANDRARAAG